MVRDGEKVLIIDTGINTKECLDSLLGCLKELKIDINEIDYFITHSHIDHFGNLKSLLRKGKKAYMNKIEWEHIKRLKYNLFKNEIEYFLIRSGFPEIDIESLPSQFNKVEPIYDIDPKNFTFLCDGDYLRLGNYNFLCITTPGHTKGHTTLFETELKLFISGDHILGEITPTVQTRLYPENPLKDYLASLKKIYSLPIECVLPSHGKCFKDHKGRIEELWKHHKQRIEEVVAILKEGERNTYEIASKMSWDIHFNDWNSFPPLQKFFAVGEAMAHLRYLEEEGLIKRRIKSQKEIISWKLTGTGKTNQKMSSEL